MRRLLGLVVLLPGAACAGPGESADANADALPRLELREELRIGSATDPDSGFSAISGVDVDRDGNVYVFESQATEIRVHDRHGKLVRRIGRRGTGPGEFEDEQQFGVVGDTVWAIDVMRRRLTLFDRRGAVLRAGRVADVAVNMHNPGEVGYILPTAMRDDGLFIGTISLYTGGGSQAGEWPVRPTDTVAAPRVLFNGDGAVVDTIGWDSIPPGSDRAPLGRVRVGSTSYSVPQPPRTEALAMKLPDGRVVVDFPPPGGNEPSVFTVTRLELDGDTVYSRRLAWRPRRYEASELDSLAWRNARRLNVRVSVGGVMMPPGAQPDSHAAFEAIRAAMSFPEHRPPVLSIVRRRDGAIWLWRGDDGAGSHRWIVLDASGNIRGEALVPSRNRVLWSGDETLWMMEPDEVDVPWLVRYRIVGGA